MVRVSNTIVTILNTVFLLLGLALIGGGIYFHFYGGTTCHKFLENSLFILGSASVAISLLGLIGSSCRNTLVLGLYLVFMVLFILCVAAFAAFMLVITSPAAGKAVSRIGIKSAPHWLENHFTTDKNWVVIKSCLVESKLCTSLTDRDRHVYAEPTSVDVLKKNLTPLMFGCCKPPEGCRFGNNNVTSRENDCQKWNHKANQLCYDCDSCKGGFLANIKQQWRNLLIFFICILISAIVILGIGCRAELNNRHQPSKNGSA